MLKNCCFLIFSVFVFSACEQKKQEKTEPVLYPNEDAPLALLMREMYVDMEEIKVSVEKGEAIKNYLKKHNQLLTARATDPKVKDYSFDLMGNGYIESLKQLENSHPDLLKANYKILYSYCIACHEKHCPGPLKKISNLQIE